MLINNSLTDRSANEPKSRMYRCGERVPEQLSSSTRFGATASYFS